MRTYKLRPITETAEQARQAKGQKGKIAKQIVLGIDAHLNSYQVCRKIDAGGLQPVQSFSLEKLLLFAYKQLQLAEKVYAVYEAGPLGYVLYRKLRELGIEAQVCAPECHFPPKKWTPVAWVSAVFDCWNQGTLSPEPPGIYRF